MPGMAFEAGQSVIWDGKPAEVKRQVGSSVWINVNGVPTVVSETQLYLDNPEHLPCAATIRLPADCEDDGA